MDIPSIKMMSIVMMITTMLAATLMVELVVAILSKRIGALNANVKD